MIYLLIFVLGVWCGAWLAWRRGWNMEDSNLGRTIYGRAALPQQST